MFFESESIQDCNSTLQYEIDVSAKIEAYQSSNCHICKLPRTAVHTKF